MFCDHLSAHSWLNWLNEDDVEVCLLKEKPKDTGFIKSLKWDRKCGKTKHNGLDSQLHVINGKGRVRDGQASHTLIGSETSPGWAGKSLPDGLRDESRTGIPRLCCGCYETPVQGLGECFTTTFLHTRHSTIWDQKDYIKMRPEAKELIPQLCHYQELHTQELSGSSLPGGSWKGVKSIPRHCLPHDCCIQGRLIILRIIYKGPHSMPHQVAFYDMQGDGCLLLPRSSMGTL